MKSFVSLVVVVWAVVLLGGCGGDSAVQDNAKDDPSIPLLIPCEACGKLVSKKTEECLGCGHPASDSVVAYKEEQELARIRTEEATRIRAEEARIKAQGGPEALARIREAEESGATKLDLTENNITDLTPLAGLTKLEELFLWENWITDVTPLAELTLLEELFLQGNKITDITPLAELTGLEELYLEANQITGLTPLAGLTKLKILNLYGNPIPDDQIEMLRKALPNCDICFD